MSSSLLFLFLFWLESQNLVVYTEVCFILIGISLFLKATEVAGVCDNQVDRKLELALASNSWKLKVNRLLESLNRPTMQQIQQHLKEVCLFIHTRQTLDHVDFLC